MFRVPILPTERLVPAIFFVYSKGFILNAAVLNRNDLIIGEDCA